MFCIFLWSQKSESKAFEVGKGETEWVSCIFLGIIILGRTYSWHLLKVINKAQTHLVNPQKINILNAQQIRTIGFPCTQKVIKSDLQPNQHLGIRAAKFHQETSKGLSNWAWYGAFKNNGAIHLYYHQGGKSSEVFDDKPTILGPMDDRLTTGSTVHNGEEAWVSWWSPVGSAACCKRAMNWGPPSTSTSEGSHLRYCSRFYPLLVTFKLCELEHGPVEIQWVFPDQKCWDLSHQFSVNVYQLE